MKFSLRSILHRFSHSCRSIWYAHGDIEVSKKHIAALTKLRSVSIVNEVDRIGLKLEDQEQKTVKNESRFQDAEQKLTDLSDVLAKTISAVDKQNQTIAVVKEQNDRATNEKKHVESVLYKNLEVQDKRIEAATRTLSKMDADLKKVIDPSLDPLMKKLLPPSFDAELLHLRRSFLSGTRRFVAEEFKQWMQRPEKHLNKLFWLSAGPGMGKSSLIAELSGQYEQQLGAIHMCQIRSAETGRPNRVIKSLAYQLARIIPEYKDALNGLVDLHPHIFEGSTLLNLWQEVVVNPLLEVANPPEDTILVMIDGLDESDTKDGMILLLEIFSPEQLKLVPDWIDFVVSSRPETLERCKMLVGGIQIFEWNGDTKENLDDIRQFVNQKFDGTIVPEDLAIAVELVVKKCRGQFLYAATVLSDSSCGQWTLSQVKNLPDGVQELFAQCWSQTNCEFSDFRQIFQVMCSAQCKLTVSTISRLLGKSEETVLNQFEHIKQLDIPDTAHKAVFFREPLSLCSEVIFFHESLRDWLTEPSNLPYFIDVAKGHDIFIKFLRSWLQSIVQEYPQTTEVINCAKSNPLLKFCIQHAPVHALRSQQWELFTDLSFYDLFLRTRPEASRVSDFVLFLSCLKDVFRLGKIPSQKSQYASLEDFLKWGLHDYFPTDIIDYNIHLILDFLPKKVRT
jgi:hypothetical protein